MNKQKTVLVTAIGTTASTTIIAQLKKAGGFHVIGGDIFLKHQVVTSQDVDEFYTFPSAVKDQEAYARFALEFCKEHQVDFYFATIDEEIVNLDAHRAEFDAAGVRLCIPNHEAIMICHYKDRFCEWIDAQLPELSQKRYSCFPENETAYPLFAKPKEGRGSNGCRSVPDRTAAEHLLRDGFREEDYILQEYCDAEIITVDLVRNAEYGQSAQIQRSENIRNASGCGIAVEIVQYPQLMQLCYEMMEKMNLNGVVNAEFFHDGDSFKIIEINPRFGAGTSFSCAAGCDIVLNALQIADHQKCTFGRPEIGLHLAKRYETYRMD